MVRKKNEVNNRCEESDSIKKKNPFTPMSPSLDIALHVDASGGDIATKQIWHSGHVI